jgi:hypothetical protein
MDGIHARLTCMRIRVLKTPPAYVVDGFDVRSLHAGHIYDLDIRLANYLVIAGYAARVEDEHSIPATHQKAGETKSSTSS